MWHKFFLNDPKIESCLNNLSRFVIGISQFHLQFCHELSLYHWLIQHRQNIINIRNWI